MITVIGVIGVMSIFRFFFFINGIRTEYSFKCLEKLELIIDFLRSLMLKLE